MMLRVRGEDPAEAMRKLAAQAIPSTISQGRTIAALQDFRPDNRGTLIGLVEE
jgi:hypothetical protein